MGPYVDLADRGINVAIINTVKMKYFQGVKGKCVLISGQIGNINREIDSLKKKKENSRKSIYTGTISKLYDINTLHHFFPIECSYKP